MLKYLTKIAMDILPSVVATVIGAYIVNHYINARPAADAPAAAVSSANPGTDAKASGKAQTASLPGPGIKAKGISEKAMMEKTAAERPAEVKPNESKSSETKAAEAKLNEGKSNEGKSTESKSSESSSRRSFLSFSREKAVEKSTAEKSVAKAAPSPSPSASPSVVATAPAISASPSAEASAAPTEEHRDAAELARAAIERLRGMSDKSSEKSHEKVQEKVQEAVRSPEPPTAQEPPRTVAVGPVLRPLPPPITVATPPAEQAASAQPSYPPYTASVGDNDPNRPIPPADIPVAPAQAPIDLRADAAAATNPRDHARNVAEDMLSAAKSVFHAVIPTPSNKFTD